MDGFKSTFSELYSSDQLSGSPDNSTSLDGQVCSSGNGADSDMLIVRLYIHTAHSYIPGTTPNHDAVPLTETHNFLSSVTN